MRKGTGWAPGACSSGSCMLTSIMDWFECTLAKIGNLHGTMTVLLRRLCEHEFTVYRLLGFL